MERVPLQESGLSTKLLKPWKGPLIVIGEMGPVNYQVKPLTGGRKPYTVYVERLKRCAVESHLISRSISVITIRHAACASIALLRRLITKFVCVVIFTVLPENQTLRFVKGDMHFIRRVSVPVRIASRQMHQRSAVH